MKIWGITDGRAGMVAQIDALAAALNVPVEHKTIRLKKWAGYLPSRIHILWKGMIVPHLLARGSDDLLVEVPPKLVISCGRRGGLAAMSLRERYLSEPIVFVHIQDPLVHPKHFDMVIAMSHDDIDGVNVIHTDYALHKITPQLLHDARTHFAPYFAHYERPVVSVLLGGSTNKYQLNKARMQQVLAPLEKFLNEHHGSLLMTTSRRTGDANIAMLKERFAGNERVYIYSGEGENPYHGMLAYADFIIATNDSVNMMTEAVATGKPFYLIKMEGHIATKPAVFAENLIEAGVAREFKGKLEAWQHDVPVQMDVVKEKVELLLANADW